MAASGRRTAVFCAGGSAPSSVPWHWAGAGIALAVVAAAAVVSARSPVPQASEAVRPATVLHLRAPALVIPAVSPRTAARPAVPLRLVRAARASGAGPSRTAPPRSPAAGPRRLALLWPSRGVVTSRFGWRIHPIFGRREFHTGVDIATRYGSPVIAARAGVVRFVGWKTGYGRLVVIDHGAGIETMYSHLSAALVSPGERVAQGQLIGRIGSSGWSTGPHLFFEIRRNGVPLDPARYLN
jgi:murein DD-endopeptidase MepM/ murein hydrolase activator NlpD